MANQITITKLVGTLVAVIGGLSAVVCLLVGSIPGAFGGLIAVPIGIAFGRRT
jgi:hypothetical protein